MRQPHRENHGFTLIELSIVLIIIGLVIGGVLYGQDLINAAATRAQIAQIEKYNTAANTFYAKYGYLPGDIPDPYASRFGFPARGQYAGEGDGNGIIEGNDINYTGGNFGLVQGAGETAMFWVDLSAAQMLDGSFTTANSTTLSGSDITGSSVGNYLPTAEIGRGNYVYVWSGTSVTGQGTIGGPGNFFGIVQVSGILSSSVYGTLNSAATILVNQAYNMDKKIDDGLPQTGQVTATFLNGGYNYAPNWTADNSETGICFVSTSNSYSASYNSGPYCALSFKMQGEAR